MRIFWNFALNKMTQCGRVFINVSTSGQLELFEPRNCWLRVTEMVLLFALLRSLLAQKFDFDDCGHGRSCMVIQDNCTPANSSCSIVSWKYDSTEFINVTIVGQGENVWVGFGFSSTAGMKNSDIFYWNGRPSIDLFHYGFRRNM